jgi:hypothetical protein
MIQLAADPVFAVLRRELRVMYATAEEAGPLIWEENEWRTGSCITFLAAQNSLPKGQLFHAAGPSVAGWTIMGVFDSKENWERFRDDVLMPRMQQGIKGGFTTPPQETAFDVHNFVK